MVKMNSSVIVFFKKNSSYIRTSPLFYSKLFKFSFIDGNIYKIINIKKLYIWMINSTNRTLLLN